METFEFETVINGTETIFEIGKPQLDKLYEAGVLKLNGDSTAWILDEDSVHYEVALVLLSLGGEE